MRKIAFCLTTVLILHLLVGCASLLQTTKVQEAIKKPKNYCKLKQAEKVEITMEDVPIYDDSPCYIGKGYGISLEDPVPGKPNTFWGELTNIWGNVGDVVIMPYSSKAHTSYSNIPDDICLLKDENGYRKEEYAIYFGQDKSVIRFVKKRKLTTKEREIWLQEAKQFLEQNYQQEQNENQEKYVVCNRDYEKVVDSWQNSTSIQRFCNDVEQTWFAHSCKGSSDDNEKCKTLKNLFVDCYYQGSIKVDETYVLLFLFDGLSTGKVQLQ